MSLKDLTNDLPSDLPNIDADEFAIPASDSLQMDTGSHKPRILLLYG